MNILLLQLLINKPAEITKVIYIHVVAVGLSARVAENRLLFESQAWENIHFAIVF